MSVMMLETCNFISVCSGIPQLERNTTMLTQSERRGWPWYTWAILLVTIAVLVRVGVGVWSSFTPALSPSPAAPVASTPGGAIQTNEGGQVTIKATWIGASAGTVFDVVMDTHAVDLDGYDLTRLAVLRVNGREVQPSSWDAPKGGHHRKGTLSFPATASDGKPLSELGTRTIELIIRDVADVPERIFRWTP